MTTITVRLITWRFCVALFVVVAGGTASAATSAISTDPVNPPFGAEPYSVGWRFQALQDVSVVSLGALDPFPTSGLPSSMDVGIWTDSGTLLGSLIVPAGTAGTLVDNYFYADLSTPISLTTGDYYRIADSPTSGENDYMFSGVSVTESSAVGFDQGYEAFSTNSLTFPTNSGGSEAYFGPNFQYVQVPEPTSFALVALGFAAFGGYRSPKRK